MKSVVSFTYEGRWVTMGWSWWSTYFEFIYIYIYIYSILKTLYCINMTTAIQNVNKNVYMDSDCCYYRVSDVNKEEEKWEEEKRNLVPALAPETSRNGGIHYLIVWEWEGNVYDPELKLILKRKIKLVFRYLATGASYNDSCYLFRIHQTTLEIIPEVCESIYQRT